ncbi:MAG: AzlD domain-containing protein [Ligilactobacillus salivarius]|nr:AzlD domain-containing protein [Ligilactobacillus salivarius]
MQYSSMDHVILIICSMIAAFIPRFLPLKFFSTRKIPEWFNEWMKYVPVSLFTALVVRDLFVNTKTYTFVGLEYMAKLLAAIIVIVVAYRSRSMGLSVLFGLVAVAILATFLTV